MRAVVQRVSKASVSVEGKKTGQIARGFCVLLGVGSGDGPSQAEWMAEKISSLRVFDDEKGKMNLSLADVSGELLVISQFTLYGDCRKGRRPSFVNAAPPEAARDLYLLFVDKLKEKGFSVETGVFQTHMRVEILNDGPVTLVIDSPEVC